MDQSVPNIQLSVFTRLNEAETAWQQLKDASHNNPYQSFCWLKAWSETIGKERGLSPVIAIARSADKTVMALPFALENRLGVKALSFLGHQNGNQNTGLWDAGFYNTIDAEQLSSLLKEVCRQAGADLLTLQNVPETWHGRTHPLVLSGALASPSPIFTQSLASEFDALFRETHSKSSRKNLLRKQRHLQSAGDYKTLKAETRGDLQRGFEAFLEQRAKRAREAGIPNVFEKTTARAFLAAALGLNNDNDTASEAPLDLWFLETEGVIRSTYLCAELGGTLYAYSNSVAHDEMLPNSPGLVLIKDIIEQACSNPELATLDLGLGEEKYKTAWAEPLALKDSRLVVTTKGRLFELLESSRTRLKSAIRNSELLWPMVRRLRKIRSGLRKTT